MADAKKPTFAGEVQFAGYSDSSRSGPRVTFRLADRDDLERFIGCEGKRYMAVLVEITDEETPATEPAPHRERMGPLCEWAVMRCKEPMFQEWIVWQPGQGEPQPLLDSAEDSAKGALLSICGVNSRKELDTNPEAAKLLHERVRKPYAAWLAEQQPQ
jgi:hypothetical protein